MNLSKNHSPEPQQPATLNAHNRRYVTFQEMRGLPPFLPV
jgi:hypothetical protein